MGVLAAVDSRGEWVRGGGCSYESSFAVGEVNGEKGSGGNILVGTAE